MNYREKIRKAIACPQFGDSYYGEWGALRLEQRQAFKRLLDELDSADIYIKCLEQRFNNIKDYLKQIHNETNHGILSSNNLIWENIERLCDGAELLKRDKHFEGVENE